MGELLPVSAVSAVTVARSAVALPRVDRTLPVHLEDMGSWGRRGGQGSELSCISMLMYFPLPGASYGTYYDSHRRVFGLNKHAYGKCLKVDRLSTATVIGLLLWF